MAELFHLQIISPAAIVVDAQATSAEISGLEGDFGVLPGHSLFFSMLRPGVLHVRFADGSEQRYFATSGYADVTPTSCTVISDHIQNLADISLVEAQEAVTAARTALANATDEQAKAQAADLLQTAETLATAVAA